MEELIRFTPVTEFTEDQIMYREMIRRFVKDNLPDKLVLEMIESKQFTPELIDNLFSQQLVAVTAPEEHGGGGGDDYFKYIMYEEIAAQFPDLATLLAVCNSLFIFPFKKWATSEQKEKYFRKVCTEWLTFYALTEPGCGSNILREMKTTAKLDGKFWILNGEKTFITNAGLAKLGIVFAVTSEGIGAFLVETETEGFKVGKPENKIGLDASDTRTIWLENVRVPAKNVLGKIGEGHKIAMITLDGGRTGAAVAGLGIAKASVVRAANFLTTKTCNGKPIIGFPSIQEVFGGMLADIYNVECAIYNTIRKQAAGNPSVREASCVKIGGSVLAEKIASTCISLMGGAGYMREYRVADLWTASKVLQIYEGENRIQRFTIFKDINDRLMSGRSIFD